MLSVKSKEESWTKVDITEGKYMSLGAVVQLEGGWQDPSAVAAAVKLVDKCVLMGPPFCRYNTWTERVDVLRLEHKFEERFAKCWRLYQEQHSEKSARPAECSAAQTRGPDLPGPPLAAQVGAPAVADNPHTSQTQIATPKGGARGKGKAKAKGEPKPDLKPSPKRPLEDAVQGAEGKRGTALPGHWSKALKTKARYHQAVNAATSVLGQIDGGTNNWPLLLAGCAGPLKDATTKLQQACNEFMHDFLINDPKSIRVKYGHDELLEEVMGMARLLDPLISKVVKEQQTLLSMKALREKADLGQP